MGGGMSRAGYSWLSRPGYFCLGGPANGQLVAQEEGVIRFEVIVGPRLDWFSDEPRPISPSEVKVFVYELAKDRFLGTVWKCKQ
jgi:hypothetical protein